MDELMNAGEEAKPEVPAEAKPKALTREQILALPRSTWFRVERVDVPELGGAVMVRLLSAGQRDVLESFMLQCAQDPRKSTDWRSRMASELVCNEAGDPLFGTAKDIAALSRLPAAALDAIIEAGFKLNNILELPRPMAEAAKQ
jgi:hypothetical protein